MELRSLLLQSLGALATLAAAAGYAFSLDCLRRALAGAEPRWWASTLRDGVNLAGFVALAGSLAVFGFPLPRALFLGFALTLVVYALDYAAAQHLDRPSRAVVPAATALTTPLLVFAGDLAPTLDAFFARAFPL